MKPFHPTKVIKRTVKIKSSDRAIADVEWVLTLGTAGLGIRRLGERTAPRYHLSWRSVIGHALIHNTRKKEI